MLTNNLFTYGTLAPEQPNYHHVENIGGRWVKAWIFGELTNRGWGSALGYPGIELKNTENKVEGWLLIANDLTPHLRRLDEFEGAGYKRVIVDVTELRSGIQHQAYVYELTFEHSPDDKSPSQFVSPR